METIEKLAGQLNISNYDVKVIDDIITALPKNSLYDNMLIIEKLFNKEITSGHYLVLGVLMGVEHAARQVCEMYENNLRLCQRQN